MTLRIPAAALAAALSLAGCASTSGTGTLSLTDIIAQVQADARLACAFVPTASTIADIIATGNPVLATAEAVASAICTAVGPAPPAKAMLRGPLPQVNGIVIHGHFTNGVRL